MFPIKPSAISRATLGRLPIYLQYLRSAELTEPYISATGIAKALGLGEVQVRKDLSAVSDGGKPKIGYNRNELVEDLSAAIGYERKTSAVIVGAGKLGRALLGFDGFSAFGLEIAAAFDVDISEAEDLSPEKPILPMEEFEQFCLTHNVRIGIITVPAHAAQSVCDKMVQCGISAIWNFAPVAISVPENVLLRQENLALSLAHLKTMLSQQQ